MTTSVPTIESIGHPATGPHLHHLRQTIAQLLHRPQTSFPGAQPISFSRKHLRALKERDYFLCEKSDGIRCLLFFTQEPICTPAGEPTGHFEEAHYLIDRKNNYYRVSGLHFPRWDADRWNHDGSRNDKALPKWDTYHVDTLLDGELTWDYDRPASTDGGKDARRAESETQLTAAEDGGHVKSAQTITDPTGHSEPRRRVLKYLVFDTLALHGSPTLKHPLDKRLARFYDEILTSYEKLWEAFPADCLLNFAFRMEKKSTQRSYGTEMLFKDVIPSLRHGSDGLIFTCRETGYVCGTDGNILKWKPAEENSIDFKLDLTFPPLSGQRKRKRGGSEDLEQGHAYGHDEAVEADANEAEDNSELDYDAIPTARLLIYSPSFSSSHNTSTSSTSRNPNPTDPDTFFAPLHLPASDWSLMKSYATTHATGLDGIILECHRDSLGRWRFNRFRSDKSEANHVSVAEKVLESIEDAVGREELAGGEFAYEVKKAWKEREKLGMEEKGKREIERRRREGR